MSVAASPLFPSHCQGSAVSWPRLVELQSALDSVQIQAQVPGVCVTLSLNECLAGWMGDQFTGWLMNYLDTHLYSTSCPP